MIQIHTIEEWRDYAAQLRSAGQTVGLVPTMGALHEGHGSLVRRAVADGAVPIVTIFVNPRQFNDAQDLAAYPRDEAADLANCEAWGAAAVVTPSVHEMWPTSPATTATTVSVTGVTELFEGEGRPGHFDGVASVVTKLFAITGPARAYFGEKDFQQLAMVRRLNEDLSLSMTIVSCPIVRDEDGLALSSRNVQLDGEGRRVALGFSRALRAVADRPRTARDVRAVVRTALESSGIAVAYAEVVEPLLLDPIGNQHEGTARVLLAGVVQGVRLIDNGDVTIVSSEGE
ncbi:MAG: pantoate--beta-alanine ligase [Actinobacteria bacterium]|nr:pantoate--beta-alanine ligase [Actinomycetota bacterium]